MPKPRKIQDAYFKQAKAEGYVARSAYKLIQINEKKRLIQGGDRVLDLGCAPGSWMQVACELAGPRGRVVGIDLKPTTAPLPAFAKAVVGDIYKTPANVLLEAAGGKFDVVISDMAPDTTGHGDHFMSVRLCRRALELLPELLAPGGNMVMKVFEGEEYPALLKEVQRTFHEAKGYKPAASRDVSREMYVVAFGWKDAGPRGERGATQQATTAGPKK